MSKRSIWLHLVVTLFLASALSTEIYAQQGARYYRCMGNINGVPSQAVLEISPGGIYTEGPGVAGRISNQYADYTFSGTLFGGNEGFVSMVEQRSRTRLDRIWIGLSQFGFTLRTEDGAMYSFRCQG